MVYNLIMNEQTGSVYIHGLDNKDYELGWDNGYSAALEEISLVIDEIEAQSDRTRTPIYQETLIRLIRDRINNG